MTQQAPSGRDAAVEASSPHAIRPDSGQPGADASPAGGSSRADLRHRLNTATNGYDAPLAAVDMGAWDANARDLVRRASGVPIRVASKSVRSRDLLREALGRPGFAGVLALTLPEALWLVGTEVTDDVCGQGPLVNALRRWCRCGGYVRVAGGMLNALPQIMLGSCISAL